MTESGQPDGNGNGNGIRTDIAHPARVYDYWLGGKDNFAVDRETAEWVLSVTPEMLDAAREGRNFLVRAVHFMSENGIRQFLDIGSGIPTSPNVHEIAQEYDPAARVVYVDNDPVVFLHSEALMPKDGTTAVVRADMRDVEEVLAKAGGLLDFSQPVGMLFVGSLHHVRDEDDPVGIVARYLRPLAKGSYLVLSHGTDEFAPERMRQNSEGAAERGATFIPRGRAAIEAMFNGLPLLEPGLVLVSYWHPDSEPGPNADRAWSYGGAAPL
jgi:SAM-dependent methyltransferase